LDVVKTSTTLITGAWVARAILPAGMFSASTRVVISPAPRHRLVVFLGTIAMAATIERGIFK
jgi:hypothetical protein